MAVSLQATFTDSKGDILLSISAAGPPGKQQEFSISSSLSDIPGNARVMARTADGKEASANRLIAVEDENKDKAWTKLGKIGDPLIVQMLLKKANSPGMWKLKKVVVTCENVKIVPAVARPPRITCADAEAGDDLLGCARYGELEDLQSVVESGDVPIDYQNEGYNTALHYASANGNVQCVEYLLSKGARHMPNSSGNTPLHWAVQNKHIGVVKVLLDKAAGIDILQKNDFGKSVLTEAFGLENADITSLLLEHSSASGLDASGQNGVVEEETDEVVEPAEAGGAAQGAQSVGGEGESMEMENRSGGGESMETDA